jgi:hypothetical protein
VPQKVATGEQFHLHNHQNRSKSPQHLHLTLDYPETILECHKVCDKIDLRSAVEGVPEPHESINYLPSRTTENIPEKLTTACPPSARTYDALLPRSISSPQSMAGTAHVNRHFRNPTGSAWSTAQQRASAYYNHANRWMFNQAPSLFKHRRIAACSH